jgi:hypothetical protein
MTSEDQQNGSEPISGYNRPHQPLFSRYNEQTLTTNSNRLNEHPSRSFKYLQEMTGEQKSIGKRKQKFVLQIKSRFLLNRKSKYFFIQ